MLPLLVGGAELSLTDRFLLSPRLAEFHDQLPKVSMGGAPTFTKGGGGGVVGLDCGWEGGWRE